MAESAVLWGTLAATGAVAWTWYYGLRATPLTAAEIAEIERHLDRMRAEEAARDGKPVEEVGPWSKRNLLLRLARTDDGKEFFAVNVIRYRRQAAYPPSWTGPRGKTGAQADAIYFRKIFGALVRRACIPMCVRRGKAGHGLNGELNAEQPRGRGERRGHRGSFVGKVYQPVLVPNEADPASGAYDMAGTFMRGAA